MITHAYAENYLDTAMDTLGEAFDYALNEYTLAIEAFMELFIMTGITEAFDHGNLKYIERRSGTEPVMGIVSKAGMTTASPDASYTVDCSPEYRSGWILAYYQWKPDVPSKNFTMSYHAGYSKAILSSA